jgi:hypothetical protein
MTSIFPQPIKNLPKADLPFPGVTGYIAQGEKEQIVFAEFEKDTDVPEHSHESQ